MNRDYLLRDIRNVLRKDFEVVNAFTDTSLAISSGSTSDEIDCDSAQQVFVTVNNKGSSTDLDVKVFCNYKEGGTYDTTPITVFNLGSGEQVSAEVSTGFFGLKVQVVNNDGTNATTVDVDVRVAR